MHRKLRHWNPATSGRLSTLYDAARAVSRLSLLSICITAACACGSDEEAHVAPNLEYRRTTWLPGLEELVTVVKTPVSVHVERADGSTAPYAALLRSDAFAYRERYGAGSQRLWERLAVARAEERLVIAVMFHVPELDEIVWEPIEQRGALAELAIADKAEGIATWLSGEGFVENGRGQLMPMFFGTLPASALAAVLFDQRVTWVSLDEPESGGEHAVYDPVADHGIDATWNTCSDCGTGNWGEEVPVGQIEWCGYDADVGSRRLFDAHQAFDYLTPNAAGSRVTYQAAAAGCIDDSACVGVDGGCGSDTVRCMGGTCVSAHGSQVASVISASKGSESGAAKVSLFMANAHKPDTIYGKNGAYGWLFLNDVRTVNESYGTDESGQVRDYWAREFDMLSILSAGNTPANAACPHSANSICVGATTPSGAAMAAYSSTLNPQAFPDREEPDLTAFGGDLGQEVQTLNFGSTTDWSGAKTGTSFSAPSVTSMVAHLRNRCAKFKGNVQTEHWRAVFRTAAWAGNPAHYEYSTPGQAPGQPSWDFEDGAGWVDAEALDWFCLPGNESNSGVIKVDLTGGEDPRGTETTYTPGMPKTQGVKPMNYTAPHDTTTYARKEYVLAEAKLAVGDRVRFTISYDVCATNPLSTSPAAVDIDLDLFLYNATNRTYVYGSQSVHDNNEGFDVLISQNDGKGAYQVIYSRPAAQTTDCGSSQLMLGWAGRWGTPW